MNDYELFSVRYKVNNEEDVYIYDDVPQKLRAQIINIVMKYINNISGNQYVSIKMWNELEENIKIELGIISLKGTVNSQSRVCNFFIHAENNIVIDLIDLIVYSLYKNTEKTRLESLKNTVNEVIHKINKKMKENSFGYEIHDYKLVRIDNQFIHKEIVKQTILLINNPLFHSVSEEFLKAHEHYKKGDYKDALVNSGKAFESTMKIICSAMGYEFDEKRDTASRLIAVLFKNDFVPEYLQNHFTGLKQTLESGLPTLRNKLGGHGQGESIIEVPESLVKYTLNLCATNIVFLVNTFEEVQGR
ncbi:hypothetical protein MKX53_15400 [Psychrobacillus sp. FSL K6-4615]|uniref:STM4504/CBY_0614 family protein n=1 Tax=Psychrobacillus sp. FSL K6-4615 TaxID=2921551 RepID=UPI0030F8C90D